MPIILFSEAHSKMRTCSLFLPHNIINAYQTVAEVCMTMSYMYFDDNGLVLLFISQNAQPYELCQKMITCYCPLQSQKAGEMY